MKTILRNASDAEIFGRMMKVAQHGTFDGLVQEGGGLPPYLDECRWWIERWDCLAILTRDVGYHTSGWWILSPPTERGTALKQGAYQRPQSPLTPPLCVKGAQRCEGPYTAEGKQCGVFHYRLFCDPAWQPLKPRGEVYTREFTEAGWKSYSELHGI